MLQKPEKFNTDSSIFCSMGAAGGGVELELIYELMTAMISGRLGVTELTLNKSMKSQAWQKREEIWWLKIGGLGEGQVVGNP